MNTRLLINEPPLQILPTLAQDIGLNESIILQQIHYWLQSPTIRHLIEDYYWVRYIPQQWAEQFSFWDQETLQRAIKNLEEKLEILISMENPDSEEAKYYTIDYWTLEQVTSPPKYANTSSSIPVSEHNNFDNTKGDGQ
jgi:hypothetical protein